MKDYSDFTPLDFARDKRFCTWVKYPQHNPDLQEFWQNWLLENPDKKEDLNEAKHLIQAILEEKYVASDDEQKEVWNSIRRTLNRDAKEIKVNHWWNSALAKAAVLLIAMTSVAWSILKFTDSQDEIAVHTKDTKALMAVQKNSSDQIKTIMLPDGTSVVLKPESTLQYAKAFTANLREVYLSGEAFFEVQKDAARPFLVHTNEIVTRVIGTSFRITNYKGQNIVVQVKTGKVSVFKEKLNADSASANSLEEGVVLTPNQQVEYELDKMKLTKSLVEEPALLVPVPHPDFEFADVPVIKVFDLIEQTYGVDIVYDKEAMINCHLTASLADVSLNEKIKLICKAIHATHEVIDTQIVVYSEGCTD